MIDQKNKIGTEFEAEVKAFLKDKLGFEDVDGGPNFHIAPQGGKNQVDVCGRYKDILFIFQCKASGKITERTLTRDELFGVFERADIATKHYKEIPKFSKCKFAINILLTKKINLPELQIEMCEERNPKVWHADSSMLEYYSELYEKIGDYAVYNFLSEFRVRPSTKEKIEEVALKLNIAGCEVFNFFADPKELLKFAYVARRRSLRENFYQRMLEGARIKKIQKFIDKGGSFPTNIIMSLKLRDEDKKDIFTKLGDAINGVEYGILRIRNSYSACWIIDGQHRLYSFAKSQLSFPVPCFAFLETTLEKERGIFLEINREQKPIEANLIWDLEGVANPDQDKGVISNTVKAINGQEVFFRKIYIPSFGDKKGKTINMAAFCNGIENASLRKKVLPNLTGRLNPLYDEDPYRSVRRSCRIIYKFFAVINKKIESQKTKEFLFGNAGVPVMLYVLEPIISRIEREPTESEFLRYVNAIKSYFDENYSDINDLNKLKKDTTSEAARKEKAKEIGIFIRRELNDNGFWPRMEETDLHKDIIEMERRIGKLIFQKLSSINTNWKKQRIPEPIALKAQAIADKEGNDFEDNLDLGEEQNIIFRKDNWDEIFKDIFIRKHGFHDENELKVGIHWLSIGRKPLSHGKKPITKEELDKCRIYLKTFDNVVPERIDAKDDSGVLSGTI